MSQSLSADIKVYISKIFDNLILTLTNIIVKEKSKKSYKPSCFFIFLSIISIFSFFIEPIFLPSLALSKVNISEVIILDCSFNKVTSPSISSLVKVLDMKI